MACCVTYMLDSFLQAAPHTFLSVVFTFILVFTCWDSFRLTVVFVVKAVPCLLWNIIIIILWNIIIIILIIITVITTVLACQVPG